MLLCVACCCSTVNIEETFFLDLLTSCVRNLIDWGGLKFFAPDLMPFMANTTGLI